MDNLTVNLGDLDLKEVVSAAILKALTDKQKEILIKDSLTFLLSQDKNSSYYGDKISPLQRAFRASVEEVAKEIITATLKEDTDIKAKISKLISDAVERIYTNDRDTTVKRIADKIIEGLTTDR